MVARSHGSTSPKREIFASETPESFDTTQTTGVDFGSVFRNDGSVQGISHVLLLTRKLHAAFVIREVQGANMT